MGTCTYMWKEWDVRNGEFSERQCQKNTWKGSEKYCIFHDPSQDKDSGLFRQEIEEQLTNKDYNFSGYCFPINWSFERKEFGESAYFRGATFQYADFRGATFQYADFRGATFQYADFRGATFQYADFSRAIFRNAYAGEATFRNAHFSGATFQGDANFNRTTFQNAYFSRINFQGDAFFNRTTFQNAHFNEARFWEYAYFSKASLLHAHFRGATFHGDACFSEASLQNAHFRGATFQGYADFKEIIIRNTDFKEAKLQYADFRGATFQYDANFSETSFQNAHFRGATFHGDAHFNGTFFQNADFEGVIIRENIEFVPRQIEKLNLQNTKFLFGGSIKADLAKAKFHRASLEKVTFIDCHWPKKIYEEVQMKDEDVDLSFKELETIYRDLKQNMQRHGDYSQAGKFYYREMECSKNALREKRFSPDWFRSFWYSLFNYTCGYGEKPLLVIRNSILIISLGAVLFFFCGVARVGADIPPEEKPYIIDYTLDSFTFCWTTLRDFCYCFYYSVVTFTTLGYGDIHPLGISHAIASVEAFVGAFFMALFVLVFGRKMMR